MSRQRARGLARLAVVLAAVAVLAIVVANSGDSELIIFGESPSYDHYIQVTVPSAFEAIPGERLTQAGLGVGTITATNVTNTAHAHLVMGVENSAWPIPSDSILTLRMGGTAKFTDRFISITKGRAHTYFADNASIPPKQFIVPVEYDQLFNIFDRRTRTGLRHFFDNTARLAPAARPFRSAIAVAAPPIGQAAAVLSDLGYSQRTLSTLVSSTAEVSDAVAAANPGLRTLITSAATTFSTIGRQSTQLQRALVGGADAIGNVGTLAYDATSLLNELGPTATRLSPGVNKLYDLAAPLDGMLHELVSVEPTAVDTLDTIARNGPSIDSLLTAARTTLLPQLTSVARQATPQLGCIRPFAPDIMNFFQGWGGFLANGLNNPHVHVMDGIVSLWPFPNDVPLDSAQVHQIIPGINTAEPAAPGMAWNQPWFQPQCGVTAAGLQAASDPESHVFDPFGNKLLPYGPTTTPNFGTKIG
jgi:ABC-type transporter Mla subunit MlaD